jgi:hypothetical protein
VESVAFRVQQNIDKPRILQADPILGLPARSQRLDSIIRNSRMVRAEPFHSLELRNRILLPLWNTG